MESKVSVKSLGARGITEEKLIEWQTACELATQGPWLVWGSDENCELVVRGGKVGDEIAQYMNENNALFASMAREAVPSLIARVRELEELLSDCLNKKQA